MDLEFHTPAHLSDYARIYQNDPRHWNFATSGLEEIHKLGGAFGLMFWSENGTISHNLCTVVVDASGRVQKVFTDNEWQPTDLVLEMKKAMEALVLFGFFILVAAGIYWNDFFTMLVVPSGGGFWGGRWRWWRACCSGVVVAPGEGVVVGFAGWFDAGGGLALC